MSWNGFKKAVGRAGTQVMMKAGQVEKTIDRDFESEERRFRMYSTLVIGITKGLYTDILAWSLLRISCRRKQKDT